MTQAVRIALGLAGVLAALGLTFWLLPSGGGSGGSVSGGADVGLETLRGELARLREELAEERRARHILASEVELLRDTLLELDEEMQLAGGDEERSREGSAGGFEEESAPGASTAEPGADEIAQRPGGRAGEPGPGATGKPGDPVFQLDQLVAAGVQEIEAQRVRDVWYEIELEKLELRDQAIREGWVNSKRFKRKLEEIKREAVDELGECGYDSLLYGTGKNNRVLVRDVLAGSAADRAGIRPGDAVLRYNDNRVWSSADLQAATSRGDRGDTVVVDLERNGARLRLRVDRGPLGLYMRQERLAPDGC